MQFVDQHTQSPPVDGFPVASVKDDLGSDILRSSANGESPAFIEDLSESKICEFQITIICDEQVLRFQIPEDYTFDMEVLEARGHSRSVKPCLICCERLNRTQVSEELASIYEF